MRSQGHLDTIVDVEPLWVVVHLVGHLGDSRHELPRLLKVFKLVFAKNGIPLVGNILPVAQAVHSLGSVLRRKERGKVLDSHCFWMQQS